MALSEHSKRSAGLLTFIVLFGAILLAANGVGQSLWARWDLTDDDVYSLSPSTVQILRGLKARVQVKAFMNRDLPAPYSQQVQFVRDKLADYQSYSRGKFVYGFVDPSAGDDAEEEARQAGCPPLQLQTQGSDKVGLQKVYMCLAFYYADKKDVLPAVTNLVGLEYEITSRVKQLSEKEKTKVAILQGRGISSALANPMQPEQGGGEASLAQLREALSQLYDVRTIDITNEEERKKLKDVKALIVAAPKEKLTDKELFAVDQFLMSGKSVGFFLDRVKVNLMSFQGETLTTGVEDLVKSYGVEVKDNLVYDQMNQRIMVMQRAGPIQYRVPMPFPPIPVIANVQDFAAFDNEHVITMKLDGVSFPFVSSLSVQDALLQKGANPAAAGASGGADTTLNPPRYAVVLARTSPLSWLQQGFFLLNPQQVPQKAAEGATTGPFPVAVAVSGRFKSAFEARLNEANADFLPDDRADVKTQSMETARIVVVGDGEFLEDQYVRQNANFTLNTIAWLANDEALNRIRSKSFEPPPIDRGISDAARFGIKYGNIAGTTLAFLLFGLVRWGLRESRRRALAEHFFAAKK